MKRKIRSAIDKKRNGNKTLNTKQVFNIELPIFILLSEYLASENINISDKLNNYDFKIINSLSKTQTRGFWIYLLKHNDLYCDICGHHINSIDNKSNQRLTWDHIVPKSKGGKYNFLNASPTHSLCNKLKTNYMPNEWEKVGLEILKNYGIIINKQHTKYNYRER